MTTRADIVAEARTWLGTRWQHQAATKGAGCDCIGLVGGVALALGLPGAQAWAAEPAYHAYGRTPDPELLAAGCDRLLDRIARADAGPGDILVLAFERDPMHFALVSSSAPERIIHAYAQRRAVVEQSLPVAGARVLRAYRYRGVGP